MGNQHIRQQHRGTSRRDANNGRKPATTEPQQKEEAIVSAPSGIPAAAETHCKSRVASNSRHANNIRDARKGVRQQQQGRQQH
jgi:hypothetical protein